MKRSPRLRAASSDGVARNRSFDSSTSATCPAAIFCLLEDDPDQAELMARARGGRGRRVRSFPDPFRALAALPNKPADLLIADLSMPWIDGKDVVASAHLRRPELRVFLVSGYPRG